jgi:RNA polymerase sigma-70 factor (ECF subfamily)
VEDFDQFYRLYSKQLYKYLLFISGDKQLAEELLQETYYQAFKSIFRFKGDSKVSTWLYQIGKNVYLKHLYKVRKERLVSIDEIKDLACVSTPEVIIENKEKGINLINALYKLKENYREIILLRSFDELSFREIGAVFNQSEGWARTNFFRAKLQLKDLILNNNEEVL